MFSKTVHIRSHVLHPGSNTLKMAPDADIKHTEWGKLITFERRIPAVELVERTFHVFGINQEVSDSLVRRLTWIGVWTQNSKVMTVWEER
jgi:hypothetical protein